MGKVTLQFDKLSVTSGPICWNCPKQARFRRRSRLTRASLRINESLDFDAVLQGVLDSARSLTSARYGVMTLLDDGGGVQGFLASGMKAEATPCCSSESGVRRR